MFYMLIALILNRQLTSTASPTIALTFHRQDQFDLALKVFLAIRSEDWYKTDLSLYAKQVSLMASKGMMDEIDRLMTDVETRDVISTNGKGLVTAIKALLAVDRAGSTVKGVLDDEVWWMEV
ncbi:hypothetical protein L1987_10095 [Smallanthus sonchifolius]|uniref:Uncharacterized protein n=1 Tax=Smallanthus sonchifolius TaxID=185202 RepID=A0ACB9JRA9_9ASTR|nr:hypothetical protein L1987_10095 [Smallanthus sonchifolius]